MKKIILLIIFLGAGIESFSQMNSHSIGKTSVVTSVQTAPVIQWQNTIGGNGDDRVGSIQQTTDGGYILGGSSTSSISGDKTENCQGSLDYWILKTDAAGNIQWQNTIGGSDEDYLFTIQQTTDGGYILGGWSFSDSSGDKTENNWDTSLATNDYWIVKTDSVGDMLWQNTIGGSGDDYFSSLQQTTDGGYILSGVSDSDISGDKTENSNGEQDYWIVKTDSLGNIQWQHTIGGDFNDNLRSIKQTSDGGYILGGISFSDSTGDKTENRIGGDDYWIVKTDATGNIQWQNTIGGTYTDRLFSAQQTTDGGYILCGYSKSNISGDKTENNWDTTLASYDYWIVKTDSAGNILWQNTIGGSSDEEIYSIQQTTDGGYILGGWSLSNISGDKTENSNGSGDYWIVKTDSLGNIQWQTTIGGNNAEWSNSIQQTADGGYIIGGTSFSGISGDKTENCFGFEDYWIIKLIPPPPCSTAPTSISPNTNDTICSGQPLILAQVGGVPGTNGAFHWYTDSCGGTSIGTGYTIILLPTATTTYYVRAEDSCGVTACASITINVNPSPAPPAVTGNTFICQGTSTTLMASGGYACYQWSTATTTQSISVSTGGTYSVTVCNTYGCTATASITVTVNPLPVPVISGNISICQGNSTVLNAGAGYSSYTWSTGSGTQTINVAIGGIYTVTVTDGNGCTGSASVTVTVNPNPVAVITPAANSAICAGDTVHFMANTGAGYTYQWFHYTTPIAGATNSFYNATANGAYKVEITDSNLCTDFSAYFSVIIVCPPPIDDPQRIAPGSANEIVIVPNPAEDKIEILNLPAKTDISIDIFSAIGKKVLTKQVATGNQPLTIDISHFAKGVYFITVDNGKEKTVKKFIKN